MARWRWYFICGLLSAALIGLIWRLVDLNIIKRSFLLNQSKARIIRIVNLPAYRGMITDRLGAPLAISVPVESVWVNPKKVQITTRQLYNLARILSVSPGYIRRHVHNDGNHEFVYLKRSNPPSVTNQVSALNIPGVYFQEEYKRFYPEGAIAAHVVGLTNVDDHGQEGLELAYDKWLSGTPGKREVVKDRYNHVVSQLALLEKPIQGHDLTLSMDHRIQYLAFRSLQSAVNQYHAAAGSVVVLNPKTGEILAMVNEPTYNPNSRPAGEPGRYRNRAVTDMFEPGSTIKSFNIALALDSGKYTPNSTIDTNPGWMEIGGYEIKDDGLNNGVINLTQVLQRSSNIGAAKILLSMQPQKYWDLLHQFGFGERTQSGFPGESSGTLVPQNRWYPSVVATLAYGYGIAVTTLQLAHAYSVIADAGLKVPVTFLMRQQPVQGQRIIPAKTAQMLTTMLETVVEPGGTGTRARVPDYWVAGKTGTAYIAGPNGYDKHRYWADFVGYAPATNPQLVVAVVLRDPKGQHFGGLVAAPVFSKVMAGALNILNIQPDHLPAS
ncbi:MAG: penicillin-binding protein 2 [Gammaproteobacteria bacterium]|nr:penicillin-binding protein 2 [Gammaproteobacteria bacterium]